MSDEGRTGRPFLEGVRVIDATEALAGPYCGALLSDLGAEVIKLERVSGDGLRKRGRGAGGRSYPFEMVHRDKRNIAVDFTDPDGAEVVRKLAAGAHVFLENFRPGVLAKYGLDAERLREETPSLIYCSISGFGQSGPMRLVGGVDLIAQGYGGLLSVTGTAEGTLAKAGYAVADIGTGMWGAIGILAALQRRSLTGEGAHIDVALADTIASWSVWEVADHQINGEIPGPLGTAHRLTAPYQAFLCGDGRWLTMAGLDRQWPALCERLGVPELVSDERFNSEYGRFEGREELAEILGGRFAERGRDEWIEILREIGIPCGPVNNVVEMMSDPQYQARGLFVEVEDGEDSVTLVNTPIAADGAPRARGLAAKHGADTVGLLTELGLDAREIERLREAGVVAVAERDPSGAST